MKLKPIAYILLLFAAVLHATNVNADFQSADPTFHVATDMQLTTGFTLSLVNGSVASGNPANIVNGDTVCSGSTIRVTPTVNAKWATSSFTAVSIYPTCGGGYCPGMIGFGGVVTNRNIKWLASANYDNNKLFGDSNDFSQDAARHDTLDPSSFSNEPVTFSNQTGVYLSGKEGGANVFCKGTLESTDGATVKGSSALPTVSTFDFSVSGSGSHNVGTRLSGVNCFAVVEKHPLEKVSNPPWFYFYYFTHNAPAIPAASAVNTININVQNSGGTCALHETQVAASSSLSDADQIMIRTRMHNTGDPIKVTSVSGSNPSFTVAAFPVGLCGVLGFPGGLCPGSNGFNETIASGGDKDLYVLVTRGGGASGGTILTFNAQTVSTACGGASSCSDTVDLTGPITCGITPASLTMGSLNVAQFNVACQDLGGDPIACVGDNWTWTDGLAGGFITKSNTQAQAYSTSPSGTSGSLAYASGIAMCKSNVTLDNSINPFFECEFIPPSATMNVSTSKYFTLNCFKNGVPHPPTTATYDPIGGLSGSTGNSSTAGTTFSAGGSPSTGSLRGFGQFSDAVPPIIGAVALAPINVINGSGNGSNNSTDCTVPTGCGPGGPGSTQYCTIGSGPLNVFTGFYGWVGIKCGAAANESCTNVTWSIQPPGIGSLPGSNSNGTFVNITGAKGMSGEIVATVDSHGHGCTKPFTIGEPACYQQT
ncbi:MAG: hypothetical protein U0R44_05770 [Candidatus Micrarchaeia archaeon]